MSDKCEWYKVDKETIIKFGGKGLLKHFGGTLLHPLRTMYPDYDWRSEDFEWVTHKILASPYKANKKMLLHILEEKLGITDPDQWYGYTTEDCLRFAPSKHILVQFGGLPGFLKLVYPSREWVPWKFKKVPFNYWDDEDNRLSIIRQIESRLSIAKISDWYGCTAQDLYDIGARGIVHKYNSSLLQMLCSIYGDVDWDPTKFAKMPRNHWTDQENRFACIRELEKIFKVTNLADWYNVSSHSLKKHNAGGFLARYGGVLHAMLQENYPDHAWQADKFQQNTATVPRKYWRDPENVIAFVMEAEAKLMIQVVDDWYRVSHDQLEHIGGAGFKTYWPKIMEVPYPDQSWDMEHFNQRKKRAVQRCLSQIIVDMIGKANIAVDTIS